MSSDAPKVIMSPEQIEQLRQDFKTIIENATAEQEKKDIQKELDKFEKSLKKDI